MGRGGIPIRSCTALTAACRSNAAAVPDGAGGAVECWADLRHNDFAFCARRISAGPAVTWTSGGVPVTKTADDESYFEIVRDEAGGALIG